MYCTQCGLNVDESYRFCPYCGAPTLLRAPVGVVAAQPDIWRRPPFNWQHSIAGLLGYAIVQAGISLALGRTSADYAREWPVYVFFAAAWTVLPGIGFSDGVTWGALLAFWGLDTVLFGFVGSPGPGPAFARILVDCGFGAIALAIVGLIRGRLEWLGLFTRKAVCELFAVAGACLVVALVLASLGV